MKVRKPRLFDDGYEDAKAGKPMLDVRIFESNVDFQIYKNGYDQRVSETKPKTTGRLDPNSFSVKGPYATCSGIW